jgi:hypothetical protein
MSQMMSQEALPAFQKWTQKLDRVDLGAGFAERMLHSRTIRS